MSEGDVSADEIAALIGLAVHDLRNPVATIAANVAFIREVDAVQDEGAREALEDVQLAVTALVVELEQLSWVGRGLAGTPRVDARSGDVRAYIEDAVRREGADVTLRLPPDPLELACAGDTLRALVGVLLGNARTHAPEGTIEVSLRREDGGAVLEVRDGGPAISEELRDQVFTLAGQHEAKRHVAGRYSRGLGLLAARVMADAIGATLHATGEPGAAAFVLRLPG